MNKTTFKSILINFLNWYAPADGDITISLTEYIAKYPERVKAWEKARAAAIVSYAKRHGLDIEEYAHDLYNACCGCKQSERRANEFMTRLSA